MFRSASKLTEDAGWVAAALAAMTLSACASSEALLYGSDFRIETSVETRIGATVLQMDIYGEWPADVTAPLPREIANLRMDRLRAEAALEALRRGKAGVSIRPAFIEGLWFAGALGPDRKRLPPHRTYRVELFFHDVSEVGVSPEVMDARSVAERYVIRAARDPRDVLAVPLEVDV